MSVADKIDALQARIERAMERNGRKKEEVQLVAVTKGVPPEKIAEALQHGILDIGESKVQECQDKFQAVQSSAMPLKWHMIGHLQRNKVNRAIEFFDCIQSVDSVRLIETIDRSASRIEKIQNCLIEVKVSDEPAKSGLRPEDLEDFLARCQSLKNIQLLGLMTLAPNFENREMARPYFFKAKQIFDRYFLRQKRAGMSQEPILSMGMSSDFEIAIEEGSNMIRVGTAIFGD